MNKKTISLTIPSTEVCQAFKNYFGYGLNKSAFLYRSLLDHALSAHGIIAPQVGILYLLEGNRTHYLQNDLAAKLGIDKASMVKMVDQLEKKKLILRKTVEKDRRARQMILTPLGKKFLKNIEPVHKKIEDLALAPFTKKEQELLRDFLPRMLLGLIQQAQEVVKKN